MKQFTLRNFPAFAVLLWLCLICSGIQAQNVSKIEYYVDTDPGFGQGVNVPITAGLDVTASFAININSLPAGFHQVFIRSFVTPYQVQENGTPVTKGGWSLTNVRIFYKEDFIAASTTLPNVVKGEYFIDTDPGFGSGTTIPVTSGSDLSNVTLTFDITSLTPGFHQLFVRFRDANGSWGLTQKRLFYKQNLTVSPTVLANIVKAEYFFDTDPGFGSGTAIAVSPASNLNNISFTADVTALATGFHNLYIRFRDSNGNWSHTPTRTFYKEAIQPTGNTLPNIVKGEYFIDNDPGFDKATSIAITAGSDLSNITFDFNITSLSDGFHKLYTRFKDEKQQWSLTNTRTFYKQSITQAEPLADITQVEYFVDTDPGFGQGKQITVTSGTTIDNIAFEVDSQNLLLGDHILYVRAKNRNGHWSITNKNSFRLEPPSGTFVTIGQIEQTLCIGNTVSIPFTVNSPFTAGNIFTAQLSDADGSFTSPRPIGTLTGTGSGSITVTIPSVAEGTNYRIRISASNPSRVSTANSTPLSIHRVPPVFSIAGDTVSCVGTKTYNLENTVSGSNNYIWSLSGGGSLQANNVTATINWATVGNYTIKVKYTGVCAGQDSVKTVPVNVTNQPLTGTFQNLLPQDNETDQPIQVVFTWSPIPKAVTYDLYVWPATSARPNTPTAANITAINYTISNTTIIQYDQSYKWQIVAKRACYELASPVRTFRTRHLPDLIVESISTPATGISETDVSVSWVVKNQGEGDTNGPWTDQVYLCDNPVLSASAEKYYIGAVSNFSSLPIGQSYRSANFTFRIPQGIQGNYYVVVTTNASQSLRETSLTNNERGSTILNISLAPPPDLQVTALTVSPLNTFSESEVTVTYTVTNKGTGPTTATNWADQISIGTSESVNLATDRVLKTVGQQGVIAPNGTYQITQKVILPAQISGQYYIHVITDRYSQVFEYTREDNNSLNSLAMTIIQRPTPNLVVSNVGVSSTTVSNGQNVTVQWTTANEGSEVAIKPWVEGIYLSTDQIFNASTDRFIGSFTRQEHLLSLSSSRMQQSVQIPRSLQAGDYYVFVFSDSNNQIYENPDETDNTSMAVDKITVINPDLKPLTLTAPATALSEETLSVQWKVKNDSPAAIYNANWTDRIYLSTNQSFDPTDVLLTETVTDQFLSATGEYTKNASVSLPAQISGNYYLILISDADNTIFERLETNNVLVAPIGITLAPSPDLEVSSLVTPTTDTVGTAIAIQYTVKNSGAGPITNKSWTDGVYLSPTPTLNEATQVNIGTTFLNRSLAAGQSYTQQTAFPIPGNLAPGAYYIIVKTDAGNLIFENNAEANNLKTATSTVNLVALPQTDLSVVTGQILSGTVTAGQPVSLQWTVKNNSTQSTVIPSWTDAVFLSTNPVLDFSDQLIGSTAINSPLGPGNTYTRSLTVTVPQEAEGTVFFIVNVDRFSQHNDPNRANNTLAMTLSGGGTSVQVVTLPPADLVPSLVSLPTQAVASQPITVRAKVKNNGTGPTPASSWIDQFYLSTDLQLGNDVSLGSHAHNGALAAGAEYTDTLQLMLPPNVSGNYYLLQQTDATNTVFERGNEGNNIAVASLFISPQQPSDLVIKEITVPATPQYAGETALISWVLANIGTNATNAFRRDAVYLSADTTLDATDVLLGTLEGTVNLPIQATAIQTLEKPLANLSIGEYYVIIKTDILNNIVEHNEGNNQAISVSKLVVTFRELPINVLTSATLKKDNPLYYRIEVPAGLTGETLAVTLKGDSTNNAVNRIFIRKGLVPTVNQYDYVGNLPFQANQEIVLPSLQTGTYYLMVTGGNLTTPSLPITLLAKVIPFGVKSVNASQGGNTGLATLKITGARFEASTVFRLKKTGTETIQPYRIQYVNQTVVFVTFDLLNKPLGAYDVEATNPGGATAVLPQSFTIRQGTGSVFVSGNTGEPGSSGFVCQITNVGFEDQFTTDVVAPANVRLSAITSFIVSYQNNGTVDIPVPTKYLLSLSENVPVAFSIPELKDNKSDLVLECKEEGGPPGILRPGASGYFKIYTVSTNRAVPTIDIVITD
ncbi:hypothetical protein IC229_07630 [Spirosoma sp. BT702]|uniref:CARDB domain-containing protein n=1 Tax=Spirosoma profusum TaxID=2771354 RepID=A0A927AS04_9BACT|nr:CARDB domain-containing protein [Spirosoma profusum]MBD2700500.1 hypothetical protein [Spirosoma profusum]